MKCAKEVMELWERGNNNRACEAAEAITEELYRRAKNFHTRPFLRLGLAECNDETIYIKNEIYQGRVSTKALLILLENACYEVSMNNSALYVTPNPSC
jgi:hypothetical protein